MFEKLYKRTLPVATILSQCRRLTKHRCLRSVNNAPQHSSSVDKTTKTRIRILQPNQKQAFSLLGILHKVKGSVHSPS